MKKFALVVAGGAGIRMGHPRPKQFLEIAGKPLLMHTLENFHRFDPVMELIVVLPEDHFSLWAELCEKQGFSLPCRLVKGGETRFHSVKNGLSGIAGEGIVFIHDGVRPLVSEDTLQRCAAMALQQGNAIPVVPVSESVRWSDGKTSHPVDRSNLFLIQTPQTFRISLIRQAYGQEYSPAFTDDASVLEKSGATIHLVEGNRENIKITWPSDLDYAEKILSTK